MFKHQVSSDNTSALAAMRSSFSTFVDAADLKAELDSADVVHRAPMLHNIPIFHTEKLCIAMGGLPDGEENLHRALLGALFQLARLHKGCV